MIRCTGSGCNPTCQRLQPRMLEAAPLCACARGYGPMHPKSNAMSPGARLLHQLLRRVSAALGAHPAAGGRRAAGAGVLGRGGRELLCALGRGRRGAHGAGVLKDTTSEVEGGEPMAADMIPDGSPRVRSTVFSRDFSAPLCHYIQPPRVVMLCAAGNVICFIFILHALGAGTHLSIVIYLFTVMCLLLLFGRNF